MLTFAMSHVASALVPALRGPVYFNDTPSKLPMDCRVQINRVIHDNCSVHSPYPVVLESLNTDHGTGFGECEARFSQGYVIVQWDLAPGFGKSFSLVGLDCPAAGN